MALSNASSYTSHNAFLLCDLFLMFMKVLERAIFFFFLGLHPRHMEVSRLGVELELQLQAYTTMGDPSCTSATYTTAHGNAESLTH